MSSARLNNVINRITTDSFGLWWDHKIHSTEEAAPHLTKTLPSLARTNGLYLNASLLDTLLSDWKDGTRPAWCVMQTLELMGSEAATHPGVIPALMNGLMDPNYHFNPGRALCAIQGKAAAYTDIILGLANELRVQNEFERFANTEGFRSNLQWIAERVADRPDIILAQLKRLTDEEEAWSVRETARRFLLTLGAKATEHRDVISVLLSCRTHDNKVVRDCAFEVMSRMGGNTAEHPGLIPVLLNSLKDTEWDYRYFAAKAICGLGEKAAEHPDAIPALLQCLMNEEEQRDVRELTAKALGVMGGRAAHNPDVTRVLLKYLKDRDMHRLAAEALCAMGARLADCPDGVPEILRCLNDENDYVRTAVYSVLSAIGEKAAGHADTIPALLKCLESENDTAHCTVYRLIGRMGETAAKHPDVLPALLSGLKNKYYDVFPVIPNGGTDNQRSVRGATAEALSALSSLATPNALKDLLDVLNNDHVRYVATKALRELAASSPDLIPALVRYLEDKERDVHTVASKAAGNIWAQATEHPDLSLILLKALREDNRELRNCAAAAVSRLGTRNSNPDIIAALVQCLSDYDESVRGNAVRALGAIGMQAAEHPKVIPALVSCLKDNHEDVRTAASEILDLIWSQVATHPGVLPGLLLDLSLSRLFEKHGSISMEDGRAFRVAASALGSIASKGGIRFFADYVPLSSFALAQGTRISTGVTKRVVLADSTLNPTRVSRWLGEHIVATFVVTDASRLPKELRAMIEAAELSVLEMQELKNPYASLPDGLERFNCLLESAPFLLQRLHEIARHPVCLWSADSQERASMELVTRQLERDGWQHIPYQSDLLAQPSANR